MKEINIKKKKSKKVKMCGYFHNECRLGDECEDCYSYYEEDLK